MSQTAVCQNYQHNLRVAAGLCTLFYSGMAAAQFSLGMSVPGFGVPLTVLAMAFAGSLIGFAHMPPVSPRRKLYTLMAGNTVLAAWFVVLIPEWREWTVSPVAQPPLAGLLAVLSVVLVPLMIKRLPDAATAAIDKVLDRAFKPTPGGGPQ